MYSRRFQFTTLLAASAIGVYVLVVAGATASVADAVRSCSSWPLCNGPVFGDADLFIAWAHRLLAITVGVLVGATAITGLRRTPTRRVKWTLMIALVLYPVQIALGAFVALSGATGNLPAVHLVTGMAIFAALVGALAWQLESETRTPNDGPVRDAVDPISDSPPGSGTRAESNGTPGPERTVSSRGVDEETEDRIRSTASLYFRLTKPRLMWLLCLVAAAGMALAAGPELSTRTVLFTLGGGVLAIGASGTFNHVIERDVDRRMERTSDRPVSTRQVPVRNALVFGVVLAAASLALFWQVNVFVAALGFVAILFYSVVYTVILKPNTVQNTVIGGFAGSLPALIGWVAVTGRIGLPGVVLAGVIFLWTPAHFYNLALAYKDDYARGGFPMMPVVRGETETRKHIVFYLGATLVAAGAMVALTPLGPLFAAATALLGAVFLWTVVKLHHEQTERAAFRAFHASNAYLGVLLISIVVDILA